jgi:hypothetical protein
MEYWQNKTEVLGKEPCASATLSTTNLTWLVWRRNWASEVRSQRLIISAMARPTFKYEICQYILWEEQERKDATSYDFAYVNITFQASTAVKLTASWIHRTKAEILFSHFLEIQYGMNL